MWALGVTAPNREFVVARALSKWSFSNHVFKLKRRFVFRGIASEKLVPAFTSYVFVEPRDMWAPLQYVFGLTFVRDGERIAELPHGLVDSLLRSANADGVLPIEEPSEAAKFCQGDPVLIAGASLLAGQQAVFQYPLANGQVVVLIDWFRRLVPVALDARDVCEVQAKARVPARKRRKRARRN